MNERDLARAIAYAPSGSTLVLPPLNYGHLGVHPKYVTVGSSRVARPYNHESVTLVGQGETSFTTATLNVQGFSLDSVVITPVGVGNRSIAVRLLATDCNLTNSTLGVKDEYWNWTIEQWKTSAPRMVYVSGQNCVVSDNDIYGCYHGIIVAHPGHSTTVLGNTIEGIAGDAIDFSANGVTITGNRGYNFFSIDANHADCIQGWSGPGVNQLGVNVGATIENNYFEVFHDLTYAPAAGKPGMQMALQGIGGFDGSFDKLTVVRNKCLLTAWHGISFAGAQNSTFDRNVMLNAFDIKRSRIRDSFGKKVQTPFNNSYSNNVANEISIWSKHDKGGNRAIPYALYVGQTNLHLMY